MNLRRGTRVTGNQSRPGSFLACDQNAAWAGAGVTSLFFGSMIRCRASTISVPATGTAIRPPTTPPTCEADKQRQDHQNRADMNTVRHRARRQVMGFDLLHQYEAGKRHSAASGDSSWR